MRLTGRNHRHSHSAIRHNIQAPATSTQLQKPSAAGPKDGHNRAHCCWPCICNTAARTHVRRSLQQPSGFLSAEITWFAGMEAIQITREFILKISFIYMQIQKSAFKEIKRIN
ncbi:hypothetical protein [Comamonas aquatilis]|uniref:hypothetical protein n=1 Tax=Comamonas aquatilis TaxID=1778406 RepID=UPI0039EFDD47